MDTYTARDFQADSDLPAILRLVVERPAARVPDYPGLTDLEENLALPEAQSSTRLWETLDGRLAAFACLDGSFLSFEIAPWAAAVDLPRQIVAWAQARAVSQGLDLTEGLAASCRADHRERIALLNALGFLPEPVRSLHFLRDLRDPIPTSILPPEYTLRPTRGEDEAEVHVDLHRAAHGTHEMTVAYRLAMLRAPQYAADLDWVAVAPDGALAAYVTCRIDPRENQLRGMRVGYTDPVATHPAHQHLGLAKALLVNGFCLLKARGMDYAELGTYGENCAMIRAAESVGYMVYNTTLFFTRPPA
jgi:ribosomal protein S18 acetylase RimI-like enzyme